MRPVLCIFIIIAGLLLISPSCAWLDGYSYRQTHYILGNASWGGSESNYNLYYDIYRSAGTSSGDDIYLGTRCQADYDDVRFTDASDNILSYYIEEGYTSSSARIWVKHTTLTTGNNTIHVYYGNSSVGDVSSGKDTFVLFDDFSAASLNTSLWSYAGSIYVGTGTVSVSSSSVPGYLYSVTLMYTNNTSVSRAYFYHEEYSGHIGLWDSWYTMYSCFDNQAGTGKYRASGGSDVTFGDVSGDYEVYLSGITNPGATKHYIHSVNGASVADITSTTLVSGLPFVAYAARSPYQTVVVDYVYVYHACYHVPIHGSYLAEVTPIATIDFAANVTSSTSYPVPIAFTATGVDAASSIWWDFDEDGIYDNTTTPATHTYDSAGVYNVTLIASFYGVNMTELKSDYIYIGMAPAASFTSNISSGRTPLSVLFTDTSLHNATAWNWSFGDGTANSTEQNPVHTYVARGTYTVLLTVCNPSVEGNSTASGVITASLATNESGLGIQYPPHQVRYKVVDYSGNPVSGVTVTAVAAQTTMGSWDWLLTLFGLDTTETDLTAAMTGTTGIDGSIDFIQSESIGYTMTFAMLGMDTKTLFVYPHQTEILVRVDTLSAPENITARIEDVTYDLYIHSAANGSYVFGVDYYDAGSATSQLDVSVTNASGGVLAVSLLPPGSYDANVSITHWPSSGDEIWINMTAYHASNTIYESRVFNAPYSAPPGVPSDLLQYLSVGFLVLLGGIFSIGSARQGAIILPVFAGILWWLGYLQFAVGGAAFLTSLVFVGIIYYMGTSRSGVT